MHRILFNLLYINELGRLGLAAIQKLFLGGGGSLGLPVSR